MKTITRNDVADYIFAEVGLSRKDSADILDAIIDEIRDNLQRGNDVKLSSFGTFSLHKKHSRVGRNPRTGIAAEITPRTVISFRPSQLLRKKINNA